MICCSKRSQDIPQAEQQHRHADDETAANFNAFMFHALTPFSFAARHLVVFPAQGVTMTRDDISLLFQSVIDFLDDRIGKAHGTACICCHFLCTDEPGQRLSLVAFLLHLDNPLCTAARKARLLSARLAVFT